MSRRQDHDVLSPTLQEAFSELRADYDLAKETRFRRKRAGVTGSGRNADYHLRSEYDLARTWELSRDFERNDWVIGQAVRRFVHNVVQDGITPDAQTGDEGLNDDLEARWHAWASDARAADVQGERSFVEIEKAVARAIIVDGDCCVLPLREGALELMEAHRLRTASNTRRNVVHGVELNQQRKRLSYWFTRDELDPYSAVQRVSDMRILQTWAEQPDGTIDRQVFHCYRAVGTRVSQTRGISAMSPIGDTAGMHSDVQFARLVQQQIVSCWAILEELGPEFRGGGRSETTGARDTETLSDGTSLATMGISPGMRIRSRPGAKLTGFSPNVPNPEFFPYTTLLLTFIAINLDLPLAILLLKPEGSFSAWRGAIDQARIGFRAFQQNLCGQLHGPTWRWRLRQEAARDPAIARRQAELGPAFYAVRWNPPRWAYIEPLTDAGADLLRMRNCMGAPSDVLAERGRQWPEVVRATVRDNALAIRRAKEEAILINKEFAGDEAPVNWRELLSLPTPDRVTVTLAGQAGEPPEPKAEPKPSRQKDGGQKDAGEE